MNPINNVIVFVLLKKDESVNIIDCYHSLRNIFSLNDNVVIDIKKHQYHDSSLMDYLQCTIVINDNIIENRNDKIMSIKNRLENFAVNRCLFLVDNVFTDTDDIQNIVSHR